jgi:hypothetical protein
MNATTDGTAAHAGRPDVPSRVLGQKHFEHALTQVSPSTTNNSELDRWHKSYAGKTGENRVHQERPPLRIRSDWSENRSNSAKFVWL